MADLADLDLAAHTAPGVAYRLDRKGAARISLICHDERGAIELWMTDLAAIPPSVRSIASVRMSGGVEIHSTTPLDGDEPGWGDCPVLPGRTCYSGGVSLVGLPFLSLIEAGDSAAVLRLLAERHAQAFGAT